MCYKALFSSSKPEIFFVRILDQEMQLKNYKTLLSTFKSTFAFTWICKCLLEKIFIVNYFSMAIALFNVPTYIIYGNTFLTWNWFQT